VPISLNFAGAVSSSSLPDSGGLTTLGAPVYGSLVFDPDLLTFVPSSSGAYQIGAGDSALMLIVAGSTARYVPLTTIDVIDSFPPFSLPDRWNANSGYLSLSPGTASVYQAILSLSDSTQTRISSNAYFTPTSLAGFTGAEIAFYQNAGGPPVLVGAVTLTQWTATPAPEPCTMALVAAGLLLFAMRRARGVAALL
jgi:hypothetical protein